MREILSALVLGAFLAGCSSSATDNKLLGFVGDDLNRTVELAQAYGKPEVAKCAAFLQTAMSSQDELLAKIDALNKEPTSGLLSGALKAALIADMLRSLNDPAMSAQLQAGFRVNCAEVAGDIMFNLAKDAAKLARRGN